MNINYNNYQTSLNKFESNTFVGSQKYIIFAMCVLAVSLLRGIVPIVLDGYIETKDIYFSISGIFLLYSMRQIVSSGKKIIPNTLSTLLYINLALNFIWLILDTMMGLGDVFYFFSFAIFPFIMVYFCYVPSRVYNKVLLVLIALLTFAVFYDFALINTDIFNGGFEIREKLRAMILSDSHAPTHTVSGAESIPLYRSVGLAGEEHDTASIFVMLTAFLLSVDNSTIKSQYRYFLLPASWMALLMTASAANITMTVVASFLIIMYKVINIKVSRSVLADILVIIIAISLLLSNDVIYDRLTVFMERFSPEVIDIMLSQQIQEFNLVDETLALFIGHTDNHNIGQYAHVTEFGIVRIAYNSGIFLFVVIMSVLLFPAVLFIKSDRFTRQRMFPYLVAVLAGLMTLIHYGSIFRSTNIILFYSFYGMAIRQHVLSTIYKRNKLANIKAERGETHACNHLSSYLVGRDNKAPKF